MKPSVVVAALSLSACDNTFGLVEVVTDPLGDAAGDFDGSDGKVATRPIAHYTLDSFVVAGRVPESVSSLDGTCSSCPSLSTGKIGDAMTFNGSSDIISVSPAPALETTGGLTAALWFRLETTPTVPLCMVNKLRGAGDQNSWQICAVPGPALVAVWDENVSKSANGGAIIEDRWHHVAMRWDGAMLTIILDGATITSVPATLTFDGRALTIGSDIDSGSARFHWDGTLDDLRIYDQALSLAEIQALATP